MYPSGSRPVSASTSASATDSTRTIDSGASPVVPSTSSWPAWPMSTTCTRAARTGAPAYAPSSRAGTSRRSTSGRARRPRARTARGDAVRREDHGRTLGHLPDSRRRRSHRAPRAHARRASCARSASARRRARRRARGPARPSRPPARLRRNSRVVTPRGPALPNRGQNSRAACEGGVRPRSRYEKARRSGGSLRRAFSSAHHGADKARYMHRGSHRPVRWTLSGLLDLDNGPDGPSLQCGGIPPDRRKRARLRNIPTRPG